LADVREALNMPSDHVRVIRAPCLDDPKDGSNKGCGHERVYLIHADADLVEGEAHMPIIAALNEILDHCQHWHFGKTEAEYQAWKLSESGKPN